VLIGWLVDTNVIASLMAPNGAPSVKSWGFFQLPDRRARDLRMRLDVGFLRRSPDDFLAVLRRMQARRFRSLSLGGNGLSRRSLFSGHRSALLTI
jgi:hypothetical protein